MSFVNKLNPPIPLLQNQKQPQRFYIQSYQIAQVYIFLQFIYIFARVPSSLVVVFRSCMRVTPVEVRLARQLSGGW